MNKNHLLLWERPLPTSSEFSLLSWSERLSVLAWLGHLAPNSHNTQPWRFYCDADGPAITIALDHACVLPESDVAGREAIISLGCAIENIVVAARAYGLTPEIYLHHVDREAVRPLTQNVAYGEQIIAVATMRFTESTPDDYSRALLPGITTRKAMRAEFDPTQMVAPRVLEELQNKTDDDIVEIHLVSDAIRKLSISEFQGQADGYVLNSPRFARELGDWLLPNDTASSVGMPGSTFGFDDAEAARIHLGLSGVQPLEPEDMLKFSLGGKIGFEKSPIVAFLTIANDDIPGWIAAGRAMERAFLILEREKISYAVHAAIVEVRLVNRIFAATLGTWKPLAAVFRIGYVKDQTLKELRPHSPRQPMESVLLAQDPN